MYNYSYKDHLLHRILHSELNEIFSGISDGKFIETFSNWLNDRHKEEYLLVIYFGFLFLFYTNKYLQFMYRHVYQLKLV